MPVSRAELILNQMTTELARMGAQHGQPRPEMIRNIRELLLPLLAQGLIEEVLVGLASRASGTGQLSCPLRWRLMSAPLPIVARWPQVPVHEELQFVLRFRPNERWERLTQSERQSLLDGAPLFVTAPNTVLQVSGRLEPVAWMRLPESDFLMFEALAFPLPNPEAA